MAKTPAPKTPAEQAAERSMAAVAANDREAWVQNFAADAVVQDPVGVSPLDPSGQGHKGHTAIAAFWDTIIGPGDVRFDFQRSYACGDEVAKVGTIYNKMPDTGVEIGAEGVFVYRVNAEGKVVSLKAYWDWDATMGDGD